MASDAAIGRQGAKPLNPGGGVTPWGMVPREVQSRRREALQIFGALELRTRNPPSVFGFCRQYVVHRRGKAVTPDSDTNLFQPNPREDVHNYELGSVLDGLDAIAAGQNPSFNFSHLLCSLEPSLSRRSCRLDERDHGLLVDALQRALEAAWISLPRSYPRAHLALGVAAARRAIDHWAQPDAIRLAGGEFVQDVRDCMRIFRNHMHNLCLVDDIAERAARRADKRADLIRTLNPPKREDIAKLAHDPAGLFELAATVREGEAL